MDNLARINQQGPVYQQYALVTGCSKERFTVCAENETFAARMAASCLVRPAPGDQVLICRQGPGNAYILAVLESAANATTLALEGDLRLKLDSGKLEVAARQGIELATAGGLNATIPRLKLDALEGKIRISDLRFTAGRLQAGIERIKVIAACLETAAQRLVQRAKRVFRSVEQDEVVRTGRLDVSATKLVSLNSQYTVMTAREDIKIDGERIHIG